MGSSLSTFVRKNDDFCYFQVSPPAPPLANPPCGIRGESGGDSGRICLVSARTIKPRHGVMLDQCHPEAEEMEIPREGDKNTVVLSFFGEGMERGLSAVAKQWGSSSCLPSPPIPTPSTPLMMSRRLPWRCQLSTTASVTSRRLPWRCQLCITASVTSRQLPWQCQLSTTAGVGCSAQESFRRRLLGLPCPDHPKVEIGSFWHDFGV